MIAGAGSLARAACVDFCSISKSDCARSTRDTVEQMRSPLMIAAAQPACVATSILVEAEWIARAASSSST
jgi:hypothetical protein